MHIGLLIEIVNVKQELPSEGTLEVQVEGDVGK